MSLRPFLARRRGSLRSFAYGQWIYLAHILGLLVPAEQLPRHRAGRVPALPLEGWRNDDLAVMIEEGRRQLDRQLAALEHIRAGAQWLFAVGAAVITALSGAIASHHPHGAVLALWILGLILLVFGIAGAAALMAGGAEVRPLDTAVLSRYAPPVQPALAGDYVRVLGDGKDAVATRSTIFRQAVVTISIGALFGLVASLIAR